MEKRGMERRTQEQEQWRPYKPWDVRHSRSFCHREAWAPWGLQWAGDGLGGAALAPVVLCLVESGDHAAWRRTSIPLTWVTPSLSGAGVWEYIRPAKGSLLVKGYFAASWRSCVHSWGQESVKFGLWLLPARLVLARILSRHFQLGCLDLMETLLLVSTYFSRGYERS